MKTLLRDRWSAGSIPAHTFGLVFLFSASFFMYPPAQARQICCDVAGDANHDGATNIGDVTHLIAHIFSGGSEPVCAGEGDANGSGSTNIADVTHLIAWIFSGGTSPVCPTSAPVDSATYELKFDAVWSAATHPTDFPPNPHFSGLVGGTHNSSVSFWQVGAPASEGIKQMAEFGAKGELLAEVTTAILSGSASDSVSGGFISPSPGSVTHTFEMTSEFPLVTVVCMIAPSPDWFVGVSALALHDGNLWVDTLIVPLYPYDAGTDDGVSYTSPNSPSVPRAPIMRINGAPFLVGDSVPALGTFTFIRQ